MAATFIKKMKMMAEDKLDVLHRLGIRAADIMPVNAFL
jgi:hypothetical protein